VKYLKSVQGNQKGMGRGPAPLVAVCHANGASHLLTFNGTHFARRGWIVATDDRKAIRIAKQAGLTVVSCPELVKAWADALTPDRAALLRVLRDIQLLAQFKPNPSIPKYQWWVDQLAKTSP